MKTLTTLIALVALAASATTLEAAATVGSSVTVETHRGDADASRTLDYADVKTMLGILFGGARPHVSTRDLDYNEDGKFDLADVDALLHALDDMGETRSQPRTERAIIGDANDDGRVDIADLNVFMQWLFGDGKRPAAPSEALDANQDGRIDIADFQALQRAVGG